MAQRYNDRNINYNKNNKHFTGHNTLRDNRKNRCNRGSRDGSFGPGRNIDRDRDSKSRYQGKRSDMIMCSRDRPSSRTRSEERRCHYQRGPGHFVRECENKTYADAPHGRCTRKKLDGLMARKMQTNVETQLNMGDTYRVMAGCYMEDNTKELRGEDQGTRCLT